MNTSSYISAGQEELLCEFSVKENAIYYAAGFVVRKLLQKYMQHANDKAMAVGLLLNMVGEDTGHTVHNASTYTLIMLKHRLNLDVHSL